MKNASRPESSNTKLPGSERPLWILVEGTEEYAFYRRALGAHFKLSFFNDCRALSRALAKTKTARKESPSASSSAKPVLVLADPSLANGEALKFLLDEVVPHFPCFAVSSENSLSMIEECLSSGFEDYFVKPFDPHLLLAKVNRKLANSRTRRMRHASGLSMDLVSRYVQNERGVGVILTTKEFQILDLLCTAFPMGVSRKQMFRAIWKEVTVGIKTLDVHLFKLRKKLEQLGFEIRCELKATYFLVAS